MYHKNMNDFNQNLRSYLNGYRGVESAGSQFSENYRSAQRSLQDRRDARNAAIATAKAMQVVPLGAATTGIAGEALGLPLAFLVNKLAKDTEKAYTEDRKEALNNMQGISTSAWRKYKNDMINKAHGDDNAVAKLAAQGKMYDDEGNLGDIDYSLFEKMDQKELAEIFTDDGAKYVNETLRKLGYR